MRLIVLAVNYWSRCEWAWIRVWISFWGSFSILSFSHLLFCKSWGVVVVVGDCGGTNKGPLLLLHPILSSPFLWMSWTNVAWKAPDQFLAGNRLNILSWELLLLLLLLCHCSTVALNYCVIALLQNCNTAPLQYCIIALLRHCNTALLHRGVIALLRPCKCLCTASLIFKRHLTRYMDTKGFS